MFSQFISLFLVLTCIVYVKSVDVSNKTDVDVADDTVVGRMLEQGEKNFENFFSSYF